MTTKSKRCRPESPIWPSGGINLKSYLKSLCRSFQKKEAQYRRQYPMILTMRTSKKGPWFMEAAISFKVYSLINPHWALRAGKIAIFRKVQMVTSSIEFMRHVHCIGPCLLQERSRTVPRSFVTNCRFRLPSFRLVLSIAQNSGMPSFSVLRNPRYARPSAQPVSTQNGY